MLIFETLKAADAASHQHTKSVAIDLLQMAAIPGVETLQLDFLDPSAPDKLKALMGGPAHVVLSDMAANATGHRKTDHLRIMGLAEAAAECGIRLLFTSEPTTRVRIVNGTEVVGRYSIQQGVAAETAASIACGDVVPRLKQAAYWNAKKAAKMIGGRHWLRLRKYVIAQRAR